MNRARNTSNVITCTALRAVFQRRGVIHEEVFSEAIGVNSDLPRRALRPQSYLWFLRVLCVLCGDY
jgi:hypothetical protein